MAFLLACGLQCFIGLTLLARSGHTSSLDDLVLHMEYIRGMVGPQRVLDVMQNPSAFITGRLDHLDRHRTDGVLYRRCPRLRLPVRALLLQQDKI